MLLIKHYCHDSIFLFFYLSASRAVYVRIHSSYCFRGRCTERCCWSIAGEDTRSRRARAIVRRDTNEIFAGKHDSRSRLFEREKHDSVDEAKRLLPVARLARVLVHVREEVADPDHPREVRGEDANFRQMSRDLFERLRGLASSGACGNEAQCCQSPALPIRQYGAFMGSRPLRRENDVSLPLLGARKVEVEELPCAVEVRVLPGDFVEQE